MNEPATKEEVEALRKELAEFRRIIATAQVADESGGGRFILSGDSLVVVINSLSSSAVTGV
jgi:hypothetical protein